MAYVPPHRRIQEGSSSSLKPTPIAPPPQQGDCSGNVRDDFRKWFAVDSNGDTSNLLLEFKPFHGKTYEHLRYKKLYTLSANPPVIEGLEVENNLRSTTINQAFPWKKICERFKDDILEEFHDMQSYIEESKPHCAQPSFFIRLGKSLFRGHRLDCHESITMDMLEKALKAETSFQESVKKSLDINIQKNIFEALQEKILAGLQTSDFTEDENYFIQVADNLGSEGILYLKCVNNNEYGGQLQLEKIHKDFLYLKHFIADISCVNKLMDLRLALITKNYSTELSEEERECIGGIVKSACIEKGAKVGLHWPDGGDSAGNRFEVLGSWHRKVTTIVGKLWTIQFKHVNRGNYMKNPGFITSSDEVTYEVDLKLTSLTKYLREQVQWDDEDIMNTLEDILKWVWTECL